MISSRVQRQLERNSLDLRGLANFRQQLPKIHELKTGAIVSATQPASTFILKYLSLTSPLKLYTVRFLANTHDAAPPTPNSIRVGLYKATSPVPADNVNISGTSVLGAPKLELIASGDNAPLGEATGGGSPTLPVLWSVVTFSKEPLLLPDVDYYLALSAGNEGVGNTWYWGESAATAGTAYEGWGANGVARGTLPVNLTPTVKSTFFPSVVLSSKIGHKRSGVRV